MQPRPSFLNGLPEGLQLSLMRSMRDLWCHTSTALEGNSLSLGDTQFILSEGLTVSGKPLKDHNEIHGHARAIDLLYAMLDEDGIDEQDVLLLHRAIITEDVADIYKPVGKWKAEPNYTNYVDQAGKPALREYPSPRHVPKLMAQWIDRCNACASSMSQAEAASVYADLHLSFVTVHPFYDGNGRMARLLSNLPILKAGFPPIVVPSEDRKRYLETISAYQESVPALDSLGDLAALPPSPAFADLCKGYWSATLALLESARGMV